MKQKIMLVFFILFLLSFNLAQEQLLSVNGFESIKINTFDTTKCQEITLNQFNTGPSDYILSLNAKFVGKENDNTFVSLKINDLKERIIWPENFACANDKCIARVFVPELKDGSVNAKICLRTGGKSVAELLDTSKIGSYESAVLKIENISPEEITLGERAKMTIKVTNTGSISEDIFVQFIAQDLRSFLEITSFDIVEGEASATTTIAPGEILEFVYYIKPTIVSNYNLPSAILFFENVFNEKQSMLSSHPQLSVLEPKQIDLTLIKEEAENNSFNFKIKIKNNWNQKFDGNLVIFPIDLIENSSQVISLNPNSEKEINFKVENLKPGNYSVVVKAQSELFEYTSESINFLVVQTDYSFEIILSVLAIIFSFAVLAFIYYKKN